MAVASDTGTTRAQDGTKAGLFVATYEISTGLAGAPTLHAQLSVYTPEKQVSGIGHITQALPTPPDFATKLDGSFTYLTVMPDDTHILVTLTGYPVVAWPPGGGIGPVLLPNCEVRMLLDASWRTGPASFWYVDETGKHEIENATARLVEPETATTIDLNQVRLAPEKVEARYVDERLVIHVSGQADGVHGIQVVELPMTIYPPEFAVVGYTWPAIGMFPYAATGRFDVSGLTEVVIVEPGGPKTYPVTPG